MATEEAGGPQLASSLPSSLTSTGPSHNTEAAPVSNSERTEAELETPLSLKRKATDPNLEIITIDPYYDLTLIVGTPENAQGQKAFRVNRGSMRNVSDIWMKMLAGDWAERNKSEIKLPDDDWKPLLLVLRMAHSQFAELPLVLSVDRLAALAVLTDKYNLQEIVRVTLAAKRWLLPYESTWAKWPAHPDMQDFAMMALLFGHNADYDYLVNKLAVEVQVDKQNVCFTYGSGEKQVKLRSDLPDRILTQIEKIRNEILQKWIECCNTAINNALRGVGDPNNPGNSRCTNDLCSVTRSGILMKGLYSAGLYPIPESSQTMYQSVTWYWKMLKTIGVQFRLYNGCNRTPRTAHGSHCNFEKCFGDFGIVNNAEAILIQYAHKDVFTHLQSDEFLETSA